jgi:SNF2 family DNA or RNA helicase
MVKTPADVFYVMNFIKPGLFGTNNRQTFITTYCELGGYMGNVPVDVREEKLPELKAIMDSNSIECELRDIRKLPKRELKVYRVDMQPKQRAAYVMMRDELRLEIEHETEASFMSSVKTYSTRLLRLQEIAAGFARDSDGNVAYLPSPKTAELIALLEDAPDTPTIIWYWWRPELEVITRALKRAKIPYSVFGEDGSREAFLSGKTHVFVSQLSKGGYGLNLQRATRMVYHSLPWDLDVYLQSQERNMRLNTTAKFLQIIHLLCRGSVDDYVRSTLLRKSGISKKLSRSQALDMLK